jgi:cystathionine gamma-synthase
MLSFELAGGIRDVRRFVETLRTFTLAESLGGIESLVAHPATMTHVGMGAEARRVAGITDGLLRLSIGLEAKEDLLKDLENGLRAIVATRLGRWITWAAAPLARRRPHYARYRAPRIEA